jgi:hypothetical protein
VIFKKETKMIIKTAIVLLCGVTSLTAMQTNERQEFMRNGRQHAAGMSPDERRAFMRDGYRHSQEHAQKKKHENPTNNNQGNIQYNIKIKQKLKNSSVNIVVGNNSSAH